MARVTRTPAATTRTFKVSWYEVQSPRGISLSGRAPVVLSAQRTVKRRKGFEVKARKLDAARALAREAVARQGVRVLTANFSRENEIVVYSQAAE